MSATGDISRAGLVALSHALSRSVGVDASEAQLARVLGPDEVGPAKAMLRSLGARGVTADQAALVVQWLAEERRRADDARAQLVWSNYDLRGARDTAVVAQELFRDAKTSVVVSTFNMGHRRQEGAPPGHPLLAPLAARMSAVPELSVRVFTHIKPWGDGAGVDHVARWAGWFRRALWPWAPLPEVYFDPRAMAGEDGACLHAKCIAVDDARALVTSANLTEAAHDRNIEAGVLLHDPALSRDLRLHFEALIARGLVRAVSWG